MTCRSCDGPLYRGPDAYQIDKLVCRACQKSKSPAVQMRLLLDDARSRAMEFEQAWEFAFSRIRWPHDTTHRREWKAVLESKKAIAVWRSAYERAPSTETEKTLAHLALAA